MGARQPSAGRTKLRLFAPLRGQKSWTGPKPATGPPPLSSRHLPPTPPLPKPTNPAQKRQIGCIPPTQAPRALKPVSNDTSQVSHDTSSVILKRMVMSHLWENDTNDTSFRICVREKIKVKYVGYYLYRGEPKTSVISVILTQRAHRQGINCDTSSVIEVSLVSLLTKAARPQRLNNDTCAPALPWRPEADGLSQAHRCEPRFPAALSPSPPLSPPPPPWSPPVLSALGV
jgi:hypothetical protein